MTAADFSDALKTLGWSQASLGRHLGITPRSMSRYATGQQPVPALLARYLELALRLHAAGLTLRLD